MHHEGNIWHLLVIRSYGCSRKFCFSVKMAYIQQTKKLVYLHLIFYIFNYISSFFQFQIFDHVNIKTELLTLSTHYSFEVTRECVGQTLAKQTAKLHITGYFKIFLVNCVISIYFLAPKTDNQSRQSFKAALRQTSC